eukprot:jgi/Botrbrau1/15732/Bobra.4_1s0101.1
MIRSFACLDRLWCTFGWADRVCVEAAVGRGGGGIWVQTEPGQCDGHCCISPGSPGRTTSSIEQHRALESVVV